MFRNKLCLKLRKIDQQKTSADEATYPKVELSIFVQQHDFL